MVDLILRGPLQRYCRERRVNFINFGDDVAFFSDDPKAVTACVAFARRHISRFGLVTNKKGYDCQHRGDRCKFIGVSTARQQPDYPRPDYLALRKELRAVLLRERLYAGGRLTTRKQLNSYRQRIGYVGRLNKDKASRLMEIFYRLCDARRKKFKPPIATSPPVLQSAPNVRVHHDGERKTHGATRRI